MRSLQGASCGLRPASERNAATRSLAVFSQSVKNCCAAGSRKVKRAELGGCWGLVEQRGIQRSAERVGGQVVAAHVADRRRRTDRVDRCAARPGGSSARGRGGLVWSRRGLRRGRGRAGGRARRRRAGARVLSDVLCEVGVTDAALGAGKAIRDQAEDQVQGSDPRLGRGLPRVPLRRCATGSRGCCPRTRCRTRWTGLAAGGDHRPGRPDDASSRAGCSRPRWGPS